MRKNNKKILHTAKYLSSTIDNDSQTVNQKFILLAFSNFNLIQIKNKIISDSKRDEQIAK